MVLDELVSKKGGFRLGGTTKPGSKRPSCRPRGHRKPVPKKIIVPDPPKPVECRNCGKPKIQRPRGLCWKCYFTPGVKEQFPSISKFGHRTDDDFKGPAPEPKFPTTHAPGTPEKMLVMERRAEAKESLFHPFDAKFEGDQRPVEWQLSQVPRAA